MTQQRVLWYFADPMCSWCWGFAPVIGAIEDMYKGRLKLQLMLGGLRPGNTEPMTAEWRAEIRHHWQEVHRRTGQPFAFAGAMPDGFVYDTEPASRAVIAVGELNAQATFPYLKAVQHAFYAERIDVSKAENLATLAQAQAIARAEFLERFHAESVKREAQTHFERTRHLGIDGFPAVVLQDQASARMLTVGYRPFADLKPEIDEWLGRERRAFG